MEAYKKMIWGSTVLGALIVVSLIMYFFIFKSEPLSPPPPAGPQLPEPALNETPVVTGVQPPEEEPESRFIDMELNGSDAVSRELLIGISAEPGFSNWINREDLIRRVTAVTDNIANGVSPAPHLAFMAPAEEFPVLVNGDKVYLNPVGYRRYDSVAKIFSSLDTPGMIAAFHQLTPAISKAYKELGYRNKKFTDTLIQAIDLLLKTPVVEDDILLEEKVKSYAFAEPRLEQLNDVQKHVLRMGPDNARKIKTKLREFRKALTAKY